MYYWRSNQLTVIIFALCSILAPLAQAGTLAITQLTPSGTSSVLAHSQNCEISRLLIAGSGDVDIQLTQDCAVGQTLSQPPAGDSELAPIILPQSLAGGNSESIHLLQDAFIHVPVQNASVERISQRGGNLQLEISDYDPVVNYTAPTVDAELADSFAYTITDRNGAQLQGTVKINLLPGAEDIPVPGDSACQTTSTQRCFEIALGDSTGVVRLEEEMVHIYAFAYKNGMNLTYSEGAVKEHSISSVPGVFSGSEVFCSGVRINERIDFNYECKLTEGQRYYLNLKSAYGTEDAYRMSAY